VEIGCHGDKIGWVEKGEPLKRLPPLKKKAKKLKFSWGGVFDPKRRRVTKVKRNSANSRGRKKRPKRLRKGKKMQGEKKNQIGLSIKDHQVEKNGWSRAKTHQGGGKLGQELQRKGRGRGDEPGKTRSPGMETSANSKGSQPCPKTVGGCGRRE